MLPPLKEAGVTHVVRMLMVMFLVVARLLAITPCSRGFLSQAVFLMLKRNPKGLHAGISITNHVLDTPGLL